MESTATGQEKENTEKQEALHKQLQDVKGQLKSSQDKVEKLKGSLSEKTEKITQLQQKIAQFETDVQSKVGVFTKKMFCLPEQSF